jgi:hypothetical protein
MFESLPGTDGDFMVALLGGFGLFWGSAPLRVPRASQRLVAFLALHGGMVRRAAVAGALWPDASESHAYCMDFPRPAGHSGHAAIVGGKGSPLGYLAVCGASAAFG